MTKLCRNITSYYHKFSIIFIVLSNFSFNFHPNLFFFFFYFQVSSFVVTFLGCALAGCMVTAGRLPVVRVNTGVKSGVASSVAITTPAVEPGVVIHVHDLSRGRLLDDCRAVGRIVHYTKQREKLF
jgi:hypothetical protein